jgi:hypothetical protein
MRYRTNVQHLKEVLLESHAATHLIEFGLRKGTIIGAVMLLSGVHIQPPLAYRSAAIPPSRDNFGGYLVPAQ